MGGCNLLRCDKGFESGIILMRDDPGLQKDRSFGVQ
jgi:hypothetical protein